MKALVLTDNMKFDYVDVPDPEIEGNDFDGGLTK